MRRGSRRGSYTVTIGVAGADEGIGVTHLVIMLANYLQSKEGCRTAAADMSSRQSIAVLRSLYEHGCEAENEKKTGFFQMQGVDYYDAVTGQDIAGILQRKYEYVIFDFGKVQFTQYSQEMMRCNIRILVGSCCEWKMKVFETTLHNKMQFQDSGSWKYAVFMGACGVIHQFEKRYHIQIQRIPYEEDPFQIHRTHFESLKKLLQEE